MPIELTLPPPWPSGTRFTLGTLPARLWLVGPNATGKSRFLRAMRDEPALSALKPRLISTDRLSAARQDETARGIWGDHISSGIPKSRFSNWVTGNHRSGAVPGVIALLYQRADLRIRVEAALSQLLNRNISLAMTDGNLAPMVRLGSSPEYSLFSDECHGVIELVALLANIYDDEPQILLIDEPEQHLHPQYQAFVLEELERAGKKAVMATHSPSFVAVKTLEDLRGVICFHDDFRMPSMYVGDERTDREVQQLLPRMSEQHRTFFFARSPVFVEGYFDATVVAAIQRALGLSAEAAGSCIIPSMGKDEAGRFLLLCEALRKKAVFLFDLDALFDRRLRKGATQNAELAARVAQSGHGDYDELVGRLQRALSNAITKLEAIDTTALSAALRPLREFMKAHSGTEELEKRRIAVLVALADCPADLRAVLSSDTDEIEGFLKAAIDHLASVDIHVLPGGALENYLPSYGGDRFAIPDEAKRPAAIAEQSWLSTRRPKGEVLDRYRELGRVVERLPSMPRIDILPTLRRELGNLLHHLVINVRGGQIARQDQVANVVGDDWKRVASFVSVQLDIRSRSEFSGTVTIQDRFGIGELECHFDHRTQTNDPDNLDLRTVTKSAT